MQEETAEEFVGLQGHGASLLPMGVIAPTKSDLTIGYGNQAGVSDGDAMSIGREIGQNLQGPGEGALCIYDPVALGSGAQ